MGGRLAVTPWPVDFEFSDLQNGSFRAKNSLENGFFRAILKALLVTQMLNYTVELWRAM